MLDANEGIVKVGVVACVARELKQLLVDQLAADGHLHGHMALIVDLAALVGHVDADLDGTDVAKAA